jgi:hypothetical protein
MAVAYFEAGLLSGICLEELPKQVVVIRIADLRTNVRTRDLSNTN